MREDKVEQKYISILKRIDIQKEERSGSILKIRDSKNVL